MVIENPELVAQLHEAEAEKSVADAELARINVGCPYRKLHPEWLAAADRVICCGMIDGLKLLACMVVSLFRSKGRLEAEIVILRHQLNILRRRKPSRKRLTLVDRLIFVWLYRLRSSVLSAVVIVQPETVVRWHREGFRL